MSPVPHSSVRKCIIRPIAFVAAFFIFLFTFEFLFLRLDPRTFCTFENLRNMDDLELVVVGNSMAAANLDPDVLDECLDTNSFLLTKSASISYCATTMAQYLFKNGHRPSRMILMFDPTFAQYQREDLSVLTTFVPFLSLADRINYTIKTADKDDLWLDRIFPIRTQCVTSFEEFWNDLVGKFFPDKIYAEKAAAISGMYSYAGRGHTPYSEWTNEASLADGSHRLSDKTYSSLPSHVEKEIKEIAALCEQYNCKLIFTTTPIIRNKALAQKELLSACNAMSDFCKENGYTYINFTYMRPEYMPDYNIDSYYDKGDHLHGSVVPSFTRDVYCRVLKDLYSGKDIDHYFYTYEEWLESIDFISDAWFTSKNANGQVTYTAYAHCGPLVKPLFRFVSVDQDGHETILRDYSEEQNFSINASDLTGTIRLYALNAANTEQDTILYELP